MTFQIFVLLVSIILMNLLVGLAVSDIQEREKGKRKREDGNYIDMI